MKFLSYKVQKYKSQIDFEPELRPETTKLLEESIRNVLLGTGLGDYFLDFIPKQGLK